MKKKLSSSIKWVFCSGERERTPADTSDKLQTSMRVTAKSRYNAAVRLQRQARFAFFTTTLLSLGLIFIPLLQNAGVCLSVKVGVLNMMQIFLAVAVLVYSVVIGTARYDVRAEKLTECGDKLKSLIRDIEKDRSNSAANSNAALSSYQTRYSDIVADSENHERSDYYLATLEMRSDYFLTGIPRLHSFASAHLMRLFPYLVPLVMIAFEIIFIADMLGATTILSQHLGKALCAS